MNKLILFTLLVLVSCSKDAITEPTLIDCSTDYAQHPLNDEYRKILMEYVTANKAPGSIIGVKKNQQSAWIGADGFSNLEYQTPMLPCTPFRTGSITKIFTAVVIIQLIEENEITLNTNVIEILPELNGKIPRIEDITIRQLLNHTSGLSHPTDDNLNYRLTLLNSPDYIAGLSTRQRLEKYIYDQPLIFDPGTESYYSNPGYWILELIVERITSASLQQNLQTRIFAPLGMTNTYFEKREDSNVSRGYSYSGDKVMDVTLWDRSESDGDPSAGIISTAEDLLVFGEALFNGQLVSQSLLDQMKITTSYPSCNGDCGYGLGIESWITPQNNGFGKNGTSIGVDANLIYFPQKQVTVVIFSNYGGGNVKDIIDKLIDL